MAELIRVRHDGSTKAPYKVERCYTFFFGFFGGDWSELNAFDDEEEAHHYVQIYITNAKNRRVALKRKYREEEEAKKKEGIIKVYNIDETLKEGEITA